MDFSTRRRSIRFRVDEDVFEAAPDIATDLALDYAEKVEIIGSRTATADEQKDVIHSLVRMVLFPSSAARFIERLGDQKNPIGQAKVGEIFRWLFEEYGLRPTESDSASSTGSVSLDAGTNSTVNT